MEDSGDDGEGNREDNNDIERREGRRKTINIDAEFEYAIDAGLRGMHDEHECVGNPERRTRITMLV